MLAIATMRMSSTARDTAISKPASFTQRDPFVMKELSHEYVVEKITEEMKNFRGFSQTDTPPSVLGSKIHYGTRTSALVREITANQKSGLLCFRRARVNMFLGCISNLLVPN
jgi:hypothetical protein